MGKQPTRKRRKTATSEPLPDPRVLAHLTPDERAELDELLVSDPRPFRPLPGPQFDAWHSEATIIGYGGAAGAGKSGLIVGLATTEHQRVLIMRQTGPELQAIIDDMARILGHRNGLSQASGAKVWRLTRWDGKPLQIEFGSFPNPGDEQKKQGHPHDFLAFDEAQNMRRSSVLYLFTWLRSIDPAQRKRIVMTFNPPMSDEGQWIIEYFAPWLDPSHPDPAKPGELRWFANIDGIEREMENGEPFEHNGETITPMSRTFIPGRVTDNPFLMSTGYKQQLENLEEPLRSVMLHGDFQAGVRDGARQVIPSSWVRAAVKRWKDRSSEPGELSAIGIDVARGGYDSTVLALRHGRWFPPLITAPGSDTPRGSDVTALAIPHMRDDAPLLVDGIGVGSAVVDHMESLDLPVVSLIASHTTAGRDRTGRFGFANLRSEMWWRAREALDPANGLNIELPNDRQLIAELTMPQWKEQGGKIKVESRDEIIKRIGRSPDRATAVVQALIDWPKKKRIERADRRRKAKDYDRHPTLDL